MFTSVIVVCGAYACLKMTYDRENFATEAECVTKNSEMVPVAMEFLARKGVPAPYHVKSADCVKSEAA